MLLDLITIASRNVSRKKARISLVVIALGLSIALITSIYTSTGATVGNSQNMIDKANSSTKGLIDLAASNSQANIDAANANASAMINKTVSSTQDMIDQTNNQTQEMIDSIQARFQDEVNQTERQMTMITVTNTTRPTGRPQGGMPFQAQSYSPIASDIIGNISSIEGVDTVVPIVTQSFGHNTTSEPQANGTGSGNGTGPGGGFGGGDPRQPRQTTDYNIYGLPVNQTLDDRYHVWPSEITNGSALNGTDEGSVLIHQDLETFFNASVGDEITINKTNLTVKGAYYSSLQNKSVYLSLSDAERLLGLENGSAYTLQVYAVNLSMVDNVTDTIRYYFPNFTVEPFKNTASSSTEFVQMQQQRQIQQLNQSAQNQTGQLEAAKDKQIAQLQSDRDVQVNQSQKDLAAQIKQYNDALATQVEHLKNDQVLVQTIGNLIIIISAITAGLIVVFMMFYTVKERTREIGVFKALGFTENNILTQFVAEGVMIGFLGGVTGIVITLLVGRMLSNVLMPRSDIYIPASPGVLVALTVLILTAALGAAGSIYPAWKASRKSSVEAMRNV
jgi:ABC-type antimicrobial peptide transport system permease subunit